MAKLYGIKNCDTVKKARRWLDDHGQAYDFHDFREHGITASAVKAWAKQVDQALLINKRSTTWKQLSDAQKAFFEASPLNAKALDIVLAQPTLIKRPVIETNGTVAVGFNDKSYSDIFK